MVKPGKCGHLYLVYHVTVPLKISISVFLTLSEILFVFRILTRCFKSALTSLFSFLKELIISWCHQQSGEGNLDKAKIEWVLEQSLEGHHSL